MAVLYVSTKNTHKLAEISAILSGSSYEAAPFPNMPHVDETGTTFEENASLKAGDES